MPLFGAVQTPTALSNGESVAVLNAENLGSGALTMAVAFTPQPTPVSLAIYNNSSQTVDLVASPDLTSGDFLPVYAGETAITVATDTIGVFQVASGLYYAIKAGGVELWGLVTYRESEKPAKLVYVQQCSDKARGLGVHPMAPTWPKRLAISLPMPLAAPVTITILSCICAMVRVSLFHIQTRECGRLSKVAEVMR